MESIFTQEKINYIHALLDQELLNLKKGGSLKSTEENKRKEVGSKQKMKEKNCKEDGGRCDKLEEERIRRNMGLEVKSKSEEGESLDRIREKKRRKKEEVRKRIEWRRAGGIRIRSGGGIEGRKKRRERRIEKR